jgi:hypothetical protein
MSSIAIRTKGGPQSYEVAETVVGGQAVEGRASSKVGVAGAGSRKFLGVSLNDAVTAASINTGVVNGVLNAAPAQTRAVLAKSGDEVRVTYAADANFGDPLKLAANGQFTPLLAADTDSALYVAKCTEPGGVTVATKATGLARIL